MGWEKKPEVGSHGTQAGIKAMRTDESHWGSVRRAREPQYLRRRQGKKSQQRKLGTNSRGGRKSRWEQSAGRWGLPKGSDATEEEYDEDIKQAFGFLIGRSLEVQ